jgi:hypothetical protein
VNAKKFGHERYNLACAGIDARVGRAAGQFTLQCGAKTKAATTLWDALSNL